MRLKRCLSVVLSLALSGLALPALANAISADELTARRAYYQAEALDPLPAIGANLLIPLGWGSFEQGDLLGGTLVLLVDSVAIGFASLIAPAFLSGNAYGVLGYGAYAVMGLLLGRVVGMVAADTYAREHNERLRQQLGLDQNLNPRAIQNSQQTPLFFSYSAVF